MPSALIALMMGRRSTAGKRNKLLDIKKYYFEKKISRFHTRTTRRPEAVARKKERKFRFYHKCRS